MATRLTLRQQDSVRTLISAQKLVARLQAFVLGRPINGKLVDLSATQVRGIEVLLRKVVPDLATIEHKGEVTHHYVAQVPAVAETTEEWQKQHVPPTMQ